VAYLGSQANDEFSAGISHQVNPGRANASSITLNDTASIADQGLDETSQRWAATTPHAVLRTAMGAGSQDDGSWERLQRGGGGYAPGSMAEFQDQLDQGSNDNTP
jgi:hypothetical protein